MKSDRIDARVSADFGEALRPEARPPEKAPEVQELEALTTRRRQIVDMITVEKNRLGSAPKRTRLQIQEHLRYLGKALKAINQEINKSIKKHPQFGAKSRIIRSMPGAGPVLAVTWLSDLPELGSIDLKAVAVLVGVAPLNRDSGLRIPWPSVRLGRPGQDSGRALYGHLGGYPLQSGYPDF